MAAPLSNPLFARAAKSRRCGPRMLSRVNHAGNLSARAWSSTGAERGTAKPKDMLRDAAVHVQMLLSSHYNVVGRTALTLTWQRSFFAPPSRVWLRQGAVLYQSHPSLRPTLRHKSGRRSKRMTHADTRLLQRLGPSICPYESLVLRAVLRRVRVVIAHAQLGVPPASVRSLRTHNAMSACTCSHRLLRTLGSERFSYGPGVRKERS